MTRASAALGIGLALSAGPLMAQTNPGLVNPPASAPQIVPTYWEKGTWSTPSTATGSAGPAFLTVPSTAPPSTGTGAGSGGGTDAMANMLATAYGQTAVTTANSIAVNPASVASVGQAESNFQNVPTANGSTSATGPWQFTQGTFQQASQQYNLGYTAADITNPQAQATAAVYYLRDTAIAVQNVTGQPATTGQAYAGYVFGPNAGAQIAQANPNAPLSSFVPAQSLAQNQMSGWTVGQFQQHAASRLGASANQPVLTGPKA